MFKLNREEIKVKLRGGYTLVARYTDGFGRVYKYEVIDEVDIYRERQETTGHRFTTDCAVYVPKTMRKN